MQNASCVSLTPDELLDTDLPRSFRGFQVEATADLVERAAAALADALAERDALAAKVKQLEAAQLEARRAERTTGEAGGLADLGSALLTAHRAAELTIDEARAKATALRDAAEQERRRLLEETHDEIARARANAERRVQELRAEEATLRATLARHREELVAFVRAAIDQLVADGTLSPSDAEAASRMTGRQLERDLRARVGESINGPSLEDRPAHDPAHGDPLDPA